MSPQMGHLDHMRKYFGCLHYFIVIRTCHWQQTRICDESMVFCDVIIYTGSCDKAMEVAMKWWNDGFALRGIFLLTAISSACESLPHYDGHRPSATRKKFVIAGHCNLVAQPWPLHAIATFLFGHWFSSSPIMTLIATITVSQIKPAFVSHRSSKSQLL